jgi:acetyl esterase
MNLKLFGCLFVLVTGIGLEVEAQQVFSYKQVDTHQLNMEVYYPPGFDSGNHFASMVFFFGGGWLGGNRNQFAHHAAYFAKRGLVCFLVDYRTKLNNTTPFESLKDAKSAIRYLRMHAPAFKIDPTKLIASGGSAGGQLAAATAIVEGYNEITDDLSVSSVPNALVLFNPVIDNGPGGYGYERIGEAYKRFSPLHNLKKGVPPTIIFLGTKDALVPAATAIYYQLVMEKLGSRCDIKWYEGQPHGFFNYSNFANYRQTIIEADNFLQSLGFLKADPKIDIEAP